MIEPVIVLTNIKDRIKLEELYWFDVRMTIGLAEYGDFYLVIQFTDLKLEDLKILAPLSRLQRRLSIKSELIDKERYNITHIVVTKFSVNSILAMTWECLSDDPALYEDLTGD